MKFTNLKPKTRRGGYYALAFLIPLLFMIGIFVGLHTYPFGNNTVVSGDFNNQYLALFSYLKNVLTGRDSGLYSLSMGLGGNAFGVLTYYLLSPFNLLVVFFSRGQFPLFATLTTLLKISGIGLAMYTYLVRAHVLQRFREGASDKLIARSALIFSSAFALMGYVIAYKECIMWLDAIIILPLMLMSIERIIVRGKIGFYIVCFSLAVITNYYFGYIIGLFSGLCVLGWILYSLYTKKRGVVKVIGLYAFANIVSLLLTAFVIIPSFLSTLGIAKNSSHSYRPVYSAANVIVQLFQTNPGVNNTPLVFAGAVVVACVILFFVNSKIRLTDKIVVAAGLIFMFVSSWLDILYLIWHVMAWPNGYVQREAFLIPFLLCIIGFVGLVSILSAGREIRRRSAISAFFVFLFIGGIATSDAALKYVFIAIVFAMITYAIVGFLPTKSITIVPVFVLVVSLCSLFVVDFKLQSTIAGYSMKYSEYRKFEQTTTSLIAKGTSGDADVNRVGNRYQANDNDPLLFGYAGLSNYVSQQPTEVTDFLSTLGYYQKHTWKRWSNYNNGSTLSMDRLLGVKYTYGNTSNEYSRQIDRIDASMGGDNNIFNVPVAMGLSTVKQGDGYITTDKRSFPIAFRVNGTDIADNLVKNYDTMHDPFTVQNRLWNRLYPDSSMFKHQLVQETASKGVYSVSLSTSGNAYMYIPTTRGIDPKPVDVYVNGKKVSQLFVNDTENGIVYLGNFEKDQRVSVSFGNHDSKTDKGGNVENTPIIVTENNTVYERAYRSMISAGVNKQQVKGSRITFSTGARFVKGNIVITVPYDSHWTAYVDGKTVTTSRALGELMAVKVGHGAHHVVLRYNVPGLKLGLVMAIVGLALIVGFESISMYRRHRENNHK